MPARPATQRGITLVEALIGLLIVSLGLAAAARMQSWLRANADLARQRTEALRLAQTDLEHLRAARAPITPAAPFAMERTVREHGGLHTRQVTVHWRDTRAGAQALQLSTSTTDLPPPYSAVLRLPPQGLALSLRPRMPQPSWPLGDGRHVLKPQAHGTLAWVLSDSGEVVAQCQVPALHEPRALRAADLHDCTPLSASLLRGHVRFDLSNHPDPLTANAAPLPVQVVHGRTRCETETVAHGAERFIAYLCLVPLGERSHSAQLVPLGWAFGATAATHKACRYDSAEGTTAPHNFLVIRGDLPCPTTAHNGGSVATVQHQP